MGKKATKPLHLQKQKSSQTNASNESSLFGPKQSSDAWYDDNDQPQDEDEVSFIFLKTQLIKFHDTAKEMSLKSLVKFWNDTHGGMSSLGRVTPPFEHAERLLDMARVALETSDFHGAKVMIMAALLILQSKVTGMDAIVDFVENNHQADESFGDDLAETLPFCHKATDFTRSPDAMKLFLEGLDIEELKSRVTLAEPLIDIVFNIGEIRKVRGVSSLTNLNAMISRYGEISKISSVRIKHNGTRLFLSSSGKKSLSDLGFANNDVIEIEDIDAESSPSTNLTSSSNCIDITNNLNVKKESQGGQSSTAAGKRLKRKGKKKGKGKK